MLFRIPDTEEEIESYSYFEDNDTMSLYEMLEHLLYHGFVEVFVQGEWYVWEIYLLDYQPHVRVDEVFACMHPDEWLYTPLDELTE